MMTDKIIIEGKDCTNCQKMSHCHNNELICQSRYRSVLEKYQAEKEKVKELEKEMASELSKGYKQYIQENCYTNVNLPKIEKNSIKEQQYKQALEEINEIATLIIKDEDKPACVNEEDCPLNGGDGFDNHCNEKCPFILAKQILQKCEVLDDV